MTTWFVSRHRDAIFWANRRGVKAKDMRIVSDLDVDLVKPGERIMGTLPVNLAAEVCAKGASYFHLSLKIPGEMRGRELSTADMDTLGATLEEYVVQAKGEKLIKLGQAPAPKGHMHICLVSAQHMPNLLPILARKPKRVVLVCTPEMRKGQNNALERHQRALEHFKIPAEHILVKDIDDHAATDIHEARTVARQIREELLKGSPELTQTLNVTGGTKILSMGFLMEFPDAETIYVDTQGGGYMRFLSEDRREPERIGSRVPKIGDYLHCQGYALIEAQSDGSAWKRQVNDRAVLTRMLATGLIQPATSKATSELIAALNKFGFNAEEQVLKRADPKKKPLKQSERSRLLNQYLLDISEPLPEIEAVPDVLTALLEHNMLRRAESKGRFTFKDFRSWTYLTGGWLEEYAWLVAKQLQPRDVKANVFVKSATDRQPDTSQEKDNELDLVVLHDNRLLIAECKTINWKGAGGGAKQQDIMNKLDALSSHARGLFGASLLISAQDLTPAAKRRAKAYGFKILAGMGLAKLEDELSRWMNSGQPAPAKPSADAPAGAAGAPGKA